MPKPTELTLEQIKLSLKDYQSELSAIDTETTQEKERILDAIRAEEAEIKSLLNQYRAIKRQKEVDVVKSSYANLTNFKKNLLLKIKSEKEAASNERPENQFEKPKSSDRQLNNRQFEEPKSSDRQFEEPKSSDRQLNNRQFDNQTIAEAAQALDSSRVPTGDGGEPKKTEEQPNKAQEVNWDVETIEIVKFIEQTPLPKLVQLYPADVSCLVPSFNVNNTVMRDRLLQHYSKHNVSIYNSLLKLYQKPDLGHHTKIPKVEQLSLKDRLHHEFLADNYPNALPFFWFLINREPDSIRYVVMEFAIDHIIQTNTLENDPNRVELEVNLTELLELNNKASLTDFLRDLFLCFHPQRVSQKANSRNRYFDYIDNLIKTQSTLQHSHILQLWNYLNKSGYSAVSSPDFVLIEPIENYQNGNGKSKSLAPASQHDLL